jgi:hypothetical protein
LRRAVSSIRWSRRYRRVNGSLLNVAGWRDDRGSGSGRARIRALPPVIHDDFEPGSLLLENVSQGWPAILANLKTLLETGDTLPAEFR